MPSDLIPQTDSIPDLSQKILEMATTGVYRESVFEALQPLAAKKQIRVAIAYAKQFGLQSVASLRDPDLGTYYQLDQAKYQKSHQSLHATGLASSLKFSSQLNPQLSPADPEANLAQRLTQATQTIQRVLALAQAAAGLWTILSLLCWVAGWYQISGGLLSAALGTGMLWWLQQRQVKG